MVTGRSGATSGDPQINPLIPLVGKLLSIGLQLFGNAALTATRRGMLPNIGVKWASFSDRVFETWEIFFHWRSTSSLCSCCFSGVAKVLRK